MTLKHYTFLSILLLSAFVNLSYLVINYPINQFDIDASRFVQQHAGAGLDKFMLFISFFADSPYIYFSLILITAAFFFINKYKREAYFILAVVPCSTIIVLVKKTINRQRPNSDLVRVVEDLETKSFPSSHVFSYTLFFGFIILLMFSVKSIAKNLRIMLAVISGFFLVLVVPSRIYLGAHWFTDTIGGILLGSLIILILYFFYLRENREKGI
ncbi:undecaprenyl-diphosphatase [Pedobacter sp. ok626]|uniref:phosphatase PAP2 family protein n=1 Tax=Pedobacter sp. ok626 TaxID=1761882 RepID=UPI0008860F4B|nr:phosphatase PAP2 family protein [Pedobacter sp. ok626]SDK56670.1 undecaprenyl-diphosphatase [Pedobacter sp. ok626]